MAETEGQQRVEEQPAVETNESQENSQESQKEQLIVKDTEDTVETIEETAQDTQETETTPAAETEAKSKPNEPKDEEKENQSQAEEPAGEKYADVLKKTERTLVDCIKPSRKLLEYLCEHTVLNTAMVHQIMCRPSRSEKAKLLIELLGVLGPQSYLTFVEALRYTGQDPLARVLSSHTIVA